MVRKNYGFTLVETMIVAAIMGIVVMGSASMLISFSKQTTRMEDRLSANNLQQMLQSYLGSKSGCENNILNKTLTNTPTELTEIRDSENELLISKGDQFDQLSINRIQSKIETPTPSAMNVVDFVVFPQSIRQPKTIMKPIEIQLPAHLNGAGIVDECFSNLLTSDEVVALIDTAIAAYDEASEADEEGDSCIWCHPPSWGTGDCTNKTHPNGTAWKVKQAFIGGCENSAHYLCVHGKVVTLSVEDGGCI